MRARLALGGLLLIIGFLIYQTGISITIYQGTVIAEYANMLTNYLTVPQHIFSSLATFIGGIIAIIGFLLSISTLATPPMPQVIEAIPELEKKTTVEKEPSVPKCKFCGENIAETTVFCPNCNRALK
jgi:hypothetical protein